MSSPQRITLYVRGRSFCRIRSRGFLVKFLHGSPLVLEVGLFVESDYRDVSVRLLHGLSCFFEVGPFVGSNNVGFLSDCFVDCLLSFGLVRSWIFFVMLLQHTLLFLGVVLFVRVWRDFLQRPIELGRCGLNVLCGDPQALSLLSYQSNF
jgi:hypothetical protein